MEINLEKIELVKDRTGVSYAEAKEALEKCEGSVVDAIIDIEKKIDLEFNAVDGESLKDSPVFQKMKEIVNKGNITKIVVKKGDKTYVNFPVTVGVAGAIIVPWVVIIGVVAALGYQCDIQFVDDKGQVIDIDGKVQGVIDKANENETVGKIKQAGEKAVAKGKVAWEDFSKEGGTLEKMEDLADKTTEKVQKYAEKGQQKFDEILKKIEK